MCRRMPRVKTTANALPLQLLPRNFPKIGRSTIIMIRNLTRTFSDGSFAPREILKGQNIFFIGGTGFLGKVTLSMLLERFPEIGKIYLMVRAGSDGSEERFWNNIFPSPAFDPVREKYGKSVQEFLREKLTIVGGDVTQNNLGYSEEEAQ